MQKSVCATKTAKKMKMRTKIKTEIKFAIFLHVNVVHISSTKKKTIQNQNKQTADNKIKLK